MTEKECTKRIEHIKCLLDKNKLNYSILMRINPICFAIDLGSKNKMGKTVTNTENITTYLFIYNSTYILNITGIYNVNSTNQTDISKINNKLKHLEKIGERYYMNKNGVFCMKYIEHNISEDFAVELLLRFKNYFFETDFTNIIFK